MTTQHTPGPWIIHKSKFTFAIQSSTEPHAGLICHVYAKGDPSADEVGFSRPEEAQANAKLIAAAPDLLAALHLALESLERVAPPVRPEIPSYMQASWCSLSLDAIREALAKAEGK